MPVSDYLQISQILDEIVRLKPRSILDVGCGIGIYGALCRVYLEGDNLYDRENLTFNKKENWKIKIDCIEGFEKYITDLHRAVYNEIFIDDARKVLNNLNNKAYELVLAIDILEHFQKEDGIAFIKELKRVGKNVIIATPAAPQKQIVPENPLEDHRSCWGREELQSFGFNIVKETPSLIGLYLPPDLQARPTRSGDVTVRLYQEGDEYGIVKLFKEVFGREMTLDEWRWKYTGRGNNKVYSSVAVNESGEVIAHYGGMPHRMVFNGREIKGIAIGDVMVNPKYRALNIFKKVCALLPEETAKEGFILGYGFPNERAMRLPEILGLYERVEDVWESVKEVRFVNSPVRFIYKMSPLHFDDRRIDSLWDSQKRRIKLAVIRDSNYLKWRYKEHPLFTYELWGIKKRWQQKLTGIVILRRQGEELLLIDFLCPLRQLAALLQKTENYAVVSGCKNLKLWHPEYLNERLKRLGFTVSRSATCIPRTTHPSWLKKDEIKGFFFYTMGDTDFL